MINECLLSTAGDSRQLSQGGVLLSSVSVNVQPGVHHSVSTEYLSQNQAHPHGQQGTLYHQAGYHHGYEQAPNYYYDTGHGDAFYTTHETQQSMTGDSQVNDASFHKYASHQQQQAQHSTVSGSFVSNVSSSSASSPLSANSSSSTPPNFVPCIGPTPSHTGSCPNAPTIHQLAPGNGSSHYLHEEGHLRSTAPPSIPTPNEMTDFHDVSFLCGPFGLAGSFVSIDFETTGLVSIYLS